MSQAKLRLATADDVRAYVGNDMPAEWCIERRVIGYALEQDGTVIALGTVTWDVYGRAWGWFSKRADVSPFLIHRKAKAMLSLLRQVDEPALYAICNEAIQGSERWLERLGFERGEMTDLGRMWRCVITSK